MADEGGMFPQHPRSGDWETLKGKMLSPYELDALAADNTGDARFNGEADAAGNEWTNALKAVDAPQRGTKPGAS